MEALTESMKYAVAKLKLTQGIRSLMDQCFFYDFLFFAQVAPLKHILKSIHPDVG
jgi:hypothetical protein